jgi:DNA helicase IV
LADLAARITRLRNNAESADWSIAVILPNSLAQTFGNQLIDGLAGYDVDARWASGEDVKESVDRVIVTGYESIVGLEFDAVFVAGCDEILAERDKADALRALWVAMTRARQYVAVSCVGVMELFTRPTLQLWCVPPS